MRNVMFFGGSGGLGSKVIDYLREKHKLYNIYSLGSKDVDFEFTNDIRNYFENLEESIDILIIFTNYNHDSFLHKYSNNAYQLERQININILNTTYCISKALESMRKNCYGRIILASSVTVDNNIMGTSVYAASKAYYENIVKTIALENGSKNITANAIRLGYMEGGLTDKVPKELLSSILDKIPLKRLGQPIEIANTISYIIENEYVNGSTIELTGGL